MKKKIKIEKSRIALKQALLHLLLEKNYNKITIQDICKQANIGRSTFYNHYNDKNDLMENAVAFYSRIAQETTVNIFITDDNMDLRSNLLRDYQTAVQYSKVIQALMSIHLPNADFEANMCKILRQKYKLLLANSQTSSCIPEELAINLYTSNALTVTKYIACHPDTANIEELAELMFNIYQNLFKTIEINDNEVNPASEVEANIEDLIGTEN